LHGSLVFGAAGFVLATGSPVGWYFLADVISRSAEEPWLYFYLTVPVMFVFTGFGVLVGFLYNKIKTLADNDHLTSLLNQRTFYRVSEYLYAMASRREEEIAVLMIDIDNFKKVNDLNNHLVGSFILVELARIIRSTTRRSDVLARFGGDEFIIFMNNISEKDIAIIAERIRAGVEAENFSYEGHLVKITISMGVCLGVAREAKGVKDFVEKSDQNLYRAKGAGKNNVVISVV